ncbi:alkaline phosphatase family protein [Rhodoplanes sp. Z2-YC6860]|uniref:alkaline phosphatase family protein n=1 Tax=Rhodoplanes sp. Z2-YC6860 TaxID=674703 RepID=UPI00078D7AA1|nr:alkaline phosphatase family protein [Rhodoplanes sp. Z2-YC6860]AMN44524.1 phosphoesterase [Rhodoplanes sp. Z2-YC6860]
MLHSKFRWTVSALALAGAVGLGSFPAHADTIKKVFVIAMENHNWTQPSTQTSPGQIFQNPAAPFMNSLVNGTSGISSQVAFANGYINAAVGDHPSEPNYIWSEAGTNFGVANDDNPYHADCTPDTVQSTTQHLSTYLTTARKSWRSYQEDINVDATNTPLPQSQWTVPLFSTSGSYTAPGTNAYNYSKQFNYAAKHNPMVFFTDTAGGCDKTTSNPMRLNYPPLQQLALDLASNNVADYTWITPNQFNDAHSSLSTGFGSYTGDQSAIATGDNFLARTIPLIMASDAYQDHGAILVWWDESEGGDDSSRKIPFMVISKSAHPNVKGVPYSNTIQYSHSSTLRTMQEIFHVDPPHGYPFLGAAATATNLSDLFAQGTIK